MLAEPLTPLRLKRLLLTGAAGNLGRATAEAVRAAGGTVVATDLAAGEGVDLVHDVTAEAGWAAVIAECDTRHGRLDGLVNNAARSVFANNMDLETLSAQQFMDVYSVNVVGAYQMTRAVAPHIKAQGGGSIVNVSSISAITGAGSSIAYAASKGALNTMTTALARALAPEIRVNAILPGAFPSRCWADGLGEEGAKALFEKFTDQVPLQSVADPESVARTAVWLLEDAGYITGEMIKIDSGMHLLGFQP